MATVGDGFGRAMLEKMGWSAGTGLGARRDGPVEAVVVKSRPEKLGVGADRARPFNDMWWETMFRDAYGGGPASDEHLLAACEGRRCRPHGTAKLARIAKHDGMGGADSARRTDDESSQSESGEEDRAGVEDEQSMGKKRGRRNKHARESRTSNNGNKSQDEASGGVGKVFEEKKAGKGTQPSKSLVTAASKAVPEARATVDDERPGASEKKAKKAARTREREARLRAKGLSEEDVQGALAARLERKAKKRKLRRKSRSEGTTEASAMITKKRKQ